MSNSFPPLPPIDDEYDDSKILYNNNNKRDDKDGWQYVEIKSSLEKDKIPCQRSLHSGAIWKDNLLIFAGYDGHKRINDLWAYNFNTCKWILLNDIDAPSPRDRHVAVVCNDELYIFGGFDGQSRVNDLHVYDLEKNTWQMLNLFSGIAPSARHSHAAVVYGGCIYIFAGYDGAYRNDFHCYDIANEHWNQVQTTGEIPRPRYRGTCVVYGHDMILHGGHDGSKHLQDTHIFNFQNSNWSNVKTDGPIPSPRDSHIAVVLENSMFIYGGSTGAAIGDFHELRLDIRRWSPVQSFYSNSNSNIKLSGSGSNNINNNNNDETNLKSNVSPGSRFCHIGVVYNSTFYIFGGYDGIHRLNDFLKFPLIQKSYDPYVPQSTLVKDLKQYVNNQMLSDVTFIVEGIPIYAHKILCLRCPYFRNMLTGEYMESKASEIVIEDVGYQVFLLLLEYLYSDHVEVNIENSMEILCTAERFGVDRLKKICENVMIDAINLHTVSPILLAADGHNAEILRDRCLRFILDNFDEVSKTSSFEEMGRSNVELVFEILKNR